MKAVIFDMDGVIVDTEPYNMRRVYEYVHSLRPEAKIEDMYQNAGRVKEDVWTRIASIIGNGKGWEETREDYERNWKPSHSFVIPYKEIFRKDTLTILKWARECGMNTAVASSTAYEKVKELLTEVEITPYLDLIISGEFFEKSKPDPAIYLKTAELLGVKPEECIAIEDSTAGITAAKCAGMTVIALKDERFGFDRSLADDVIETLGDFIQHIQIFINK